MQTEEQLNRRINSANDLRDIVRTMKSLAAVSITHYEKAVESIDEYYRTVLLGLQAVLQTGGVAGHRRGRGPRERRLGIVVFGSDQGMCGGFNDRIVDYTVARLKQSGDHPDSVRIACVGTRAAALLEAEGLIPEFVYPVPGALAGISPQSQDILARFDSWQAEERINTIKLLHNSKARGVSYEQETVHLLPLASEWYEDVVSRPWPSPALPCHTMDSNRLFSELVSQYLFVCLYRAFAQSMATENASRLSSMQAAEQNIEERLESLTSAYRQQRQSSITSELLDIVAGFEALSGS